MLKDDDIVLDQKLLLTLYVNIKVWVLLVEIVDCYILQVSNRRDEPAIYPRSMESRMRKQNKNAINHSREGAREKFGLSQVSIGNVNGFFANASPKFESGQRGRIVSWRYLWIENIS